MAWVLLTISDQQFRTLIEYSSNIISIHVKDGTMVYQSPSVKTVLGYEPAELITRNVFDYVAPESVAPAREAYDKMLAAPGVPVAPAAPGPRPAATPRPAPWSAP